MSISESFAVSMMIGTVERARSSRHTSVPGQAGSMRSSSTRSAPRWSKAVIADGPVGGDLHLVALALEQEAQRVAEGDLVLDEQDAGHVRSPRSGVATRVADSVARDERRAPRLGLPADAGGSCDAACSRRASSASGSGSGTVSATGSRIMNVEPRPGFDHARTSPPWFCTCASRC
jgi:hypothetical protein